MTGCYDIRAAARSRCAARAPTRCRPGPYRGAGRPEAAYLLELTVDRAARELGLEPAELRRRNLIRSFPYRSALGWTYDSGDYARCLDRALELRSSARARTAGRAPGVAMYVERAGGNWESARVSVGSDGRVVAQSGSSPARPGTRDDVCADRGGSPGDRSRRCRAFGDSARSRASGRSPAARSPWAARRWCRRASGSWSRGHGRSRAAARTAGSRRSSAVGTRVGRAGRSRRSRWVEAAPAGLEAEARFESDLVFGSGAYARRWSRSSARPARCTVRRLAAVDDAGTIVNPLLAEGQVHGGIVQGLGAVLMEEAVHDVDGQPRNASFIEYSLPSAVEVPPIATAFVETPSPNLAGHGRRL